jgi:hypothetical protein
MLNTRWPSCANYGSHVRKHAVWGGSTRLQSRSEPAGSRSKRVVQATRQHGATSLVRPHHCTKRRTLDVVALARRVVPSLRAHANGLPLHTHPWRSPTDCRGDPGGELAVSRAGLQRRSHFGTQRESRVWEDKLWGSRSSMGLFVPTF